MAARQKQTYPIPNLLALLGVLLWVGSSLAGCRGKKELTAQETVGKRLYDVRCAHCHEDNDLGLKKVPPNLHGVFDQSVLPSGAPATDQQVAQTVVAGKAMMPPFAGRFNDAQMADLLAYLHTGLR
ncbi:MAG: cytochrome c [Acidobacteriota bacterium]|nr:cytochrome c [Acidobacteriota bacterium]